ncbi:hypothetical protein YC2023_084866 [Brassica napus]
MLNTTNKIQSRTDLFMLHLIRVCGECGCNIKNTLQQTYQLCSYPIFTPQALAADQFYIVSNTSITANPTSTWVQRN